VNVFSLNGSSSWLNLGIAAWPLHSHRPFYDALSAPCLALLALNTNRYTVKLGAVIKAGYNLAQLNAIELRGFRIYSIG